MSDRDKFTLRVFCTMLGTSLLMLPTGLFFFWGNLSIYTLSYFLVAETPTSQIQSPWIVALFLEAWTILMPIGGFSVLVIGRKMTLFISVAMYAICFFICYFIIDSSFIAFTIVLGLCSGIGTGLSHALLIEIAVEWTDKYVGIVTTIVESSMNIGGAIINQFVTLYINPNYLNADWSVGPNKFFSQTEVIARVPSTYLILAIVYFVIQILGICLISGPFLACETIKGKRCCKLSREKETSTFTSGSSIDYNTMSEDSVVKQEDSVQKRVLKKLVNSRKFYALWVLGSVSDFASIVAFDYYKQVGRSGIRDEDFLTSQGTATIVLVIIVTCGFGIIVDKIGVKKTLMSILFILTITFSFYPITPLAGKALYFIMTVLLVGCTTALAGIFGPAVVIVFGHENFSITFGFVWSSSCVINLLAPVIINPIVERLGLIFLFNTVAVCTFFGLFLVIVLF